MKTARQRIMAANDEMTDGALRVLGVAYRMCAKRPRILKIASNWNAT